MFQPYWESLKNYTVPTWFKDAKLGIFIHWGPYSVPASDNEWYPRNMYRRDQSLFKRHRAKWGEDFGYKDFIPLFKGEEFDPKAWIDLFVSAGAKYVVPVAEHHDGFAMYETEFTRWNAVNMGPKRDIIRELQQAAQAAGIHFGVSSHRAYNWRFFTYEDGFDTSDPSLADLYSPAHAPDQPAPLSWLNDWHLRTRELIDRFEPDILYFDFGWHEAEFTPYRPEIAAYYYNQASKWGHEVVLNYKDGFPEGTAVYDVERGKLSDIRDHYWQTDTSVSYKAWCHIEDDEFKTPTTIIHDLIDIVSKNGNLLLNVGPQANGLIPAAQVAILRELGTWLSVHGEAIYGTRPWEKFGTGHASIADGWHTERNNDPLSATDLRFTTKGKDIYIFLPAWPGATVTIEPFNTLSSIRGDDIESAKLLGTHQTLTWQQTAAGMTIQLPDSPPNKYASVIKLKHR